MESKNVTRTELIQVLIDRHQLNSYLEIGVQNPDQNFNKIKCDYKVCVDPDENAEASFKMTSDEFFEMLDLTPKGRFYLPGTYKCGVVPMQYSIVFIDGLHSAEQVKKDVENAMRYLADGGMIICHDTNPETEDLTHFPRDKKGPWNGSTYKFAAGLVYAEMDYKTVNIDHGLTIIPKQEMKDVPIDCFTWETFERERWHMLNMISWEDFINGK